LNWSGNTSSCPISHNAPEPDHRASTAGRMKKISLVLISEQAKRADCIESLGNGFPRCEGRVFYGCDSHARHWPVSNRDCSPREPLPFAGCCLLARSTHRYDALLTSSKPKTYAPLTSTSLPATRSQPVRPLKICELHGSLVSVQNHLLLNGLLVLNKHTDLFRICNISRQCCAARMTCQSPRPNVLRAAAENARDGQMV
jgi:hypothetical protein